MKLYRNKNRLLILILAVGFVIGILYENIVSGSGGMSIELFQSYFLRQYVKTDIVAEAYLWYVTKLRVIPLLILCFCKEFRWRKIAVGVGAVWTGFLAGILTVSAVMQLGMKGIFLCIVLMLPHMFFYGLAYGMICVYLYRYPERQWNGAKTIFVILMMFLGLFLETYLNPILVRWVIKII